VAAVALPGENLERYHALRQAIFADLAPRSAIEWLLTIDVAELSWEIRRYRILRHRLLEAYRQNAIPPPWQRRNVAFESDLVIRRCRLNVRFARKRTRLAINEYTLGRRRRVTTPIRQKSIKKRLNKIRALSAGNGSRIKLVIPLPDNVSDSVIRRCWLDVRLARKRTLDLPLAFQRVHVRYRMTTNVPAPVKAVRPMENRTLKSSARLVLKWRSPLFVCQTGAFAN
jgi:hypothetical protein